MQGFGLFRAMSVALICSAATAFSGSASFAFAIQADSIASAERDFDRLDGAAGVRSGGAFPFDFQHLAYFDVDANGAPSRYAHLWTAASVQADRVRGVFDDGWTYSLDMTAELYAADTLAFQTRSRTTFKLPAQVPRDHPSGFPIHTEIRVPPGEYDYRIVIRDNNWEADRSVNEKRGRLVVPPAITAQPFISSIAVAADSGGTWSPTEGIDLKLNAARIVQTNARPYVYFEAYGLTPGGDYRGELRLVSRWVSRGQGERFTGDYQPFQMQYRGSVPADPSEPVRAVLRLVLDNTEPGPYEIQVRVRDLETGRASEVRTARLKVRLPDRFRRNVPYAGVRGEGGR